MLFARWMDDVVAAGLPEPTAMVLATVSPAGRPRARTVLLKDYGPAGFVFYTNRSSAKGRALAANPYACLVFPWHPIQRQVIIEGPVQALSTSESEPYFHSRPRGSQLGAWASRQSSVLASRAELEDALPGAGSALAGGDGRADAGVLGRLPRAARRSWSSGRGGRAACMTGSATAARTRTGCSSAWRP